MSTEILALPSPPENIKEKLLRIPLFTGMGSDELQHLVGNTKMEFLKFSPGQLIASQGDKCGRLLLLIDGNITCHSITDDGRYAITEDITPPSALQTSRLFGLFQLSTHTLTSKTTTSLIGIEKSELMKIVSSSIIFRINLINILSTALQRMENDLWRTEGHDISTTMVSFFRRHCISPSGAKTFHIKMTTLAEELNTNRLTVSQALNRMQDKGLLTLHRGRIEIPALQKMLTL